ncbi:MAG: AraC family transcriptional regulator [Chromatiaceae bacterium]
MNPTLLASAARILWRVIERHGVDPVVVFREAGLDPDQMNESRARYADSKTRAAWREASRLIGNPCFGLLAADVWRPTDFHALGYAFLASRTLRTAIERVVRYNAVVDPIVHFQSTQDEAQLRLTFHVEDLDLPDVPALQDARWAVVLGLCRAAYGPGFNPAEVSFTHPAPDCRGDYFGLFRCPIRFDAAAPEFILDRARADAPLPTANRELALANDTILAAYVGELTAPDIVSRVKAAVVEHLPSGAPSAATVAKDLFMSARTLQRKLGDAGTGYSDVLEAVRRELAEHYIADPTKTLSEITFLLGFSEQSAFSRAFRRWSGQSPTAARVATE